MLYTESVIKNAQMGVFYSREYVNVASPFRSTNVSGVNCSIVYVSVNSMV